jgi:hypothetical protein
MTSQSARAGVPIGLVFLAGLYLVLSPWVVAAAGQFSIAASNTITGLSLALLAVGFARPTHRLSGIAGVTPVIGGWVIGSPWAIYRGSGVVPMDIPGAPSLTTGAWLNNVIVGAVVVVAGIVLTVSASRPTPVEPAASAVRSN